MRWITWQKQTELARLIRNCIDTGSTADYVVKSILLDYPGVYTADQIRKELDWLLGLCLVVSDDGYIKVTEWAHDAVIAALEAQNQSAAYSWVECLRLLKGRGIWHPDMIQYGVVTKEEAP